LLVDVLRGTARLLFPGVVAGAVLAALAARLLQVVFVGVNVLNPMTYLVVAFVEFAVVLLACISPAVRAARIDPLNALRSE
jgi:ABC-type lipoprotein release transport system permease subunit